jgi:hypothetical protein
MNISFLGPRVKPEDKLLHLAFGLDPEAQTKNKMNISFLGPRVKPEDKLLYLAFGLDPEVQTKNKKKNISIKIQ